MVVGGGIAGLTAAYLLGADHDVVLLEASPVLGGKLRGADVAGVRVDVGAEAMLARRPEGVDLARELGLPVVHPATTASRVWSRGALRPLPRSILGVPTDLDGLAASGVLSEDGLARVRQEPGLPTTPLDRDLSVGALVSARLGDEVVDRLVEPLLGGVYAGRSWALSARAATPQIVAMATRGSLLEQAAALPQVDGPVFAGIDGGVHRLAEALAASGRFEPRTGATVRAAGPPRRRLPVDRRRDPRPRARGRRRRRPRDAAGTVGPAAGRAGARRGERARGDRDGVDGDRHPGVPRRRRPLGPGRVRLPRAARRGAGERLGGQGVDVLLRQVGLGPGPWRRPPGPAHLARPRGEEATLQVGDEVLVARSLADLADLAGLHARPVESHVQRWGGALPQYAVGHLDRIARVRAAVAEVPGLAVCGAAYDGVGHPRRHRHGPRGGRPDGLWRRGTMTS